MMLSDAVRENMQKVLNDKYFELTRFCKAEKIDCELCVHTVDDCIGVTKYSLNSYADEDISEDEIQEYCNRENIQLLDGSVFFASNKQNYIIEVIDLKQSGLDIIDPSDYLKQFFEDTYSRDGYHFRIIKAPLLKTFVQIMREKKFLEKNIPRNPVADKSKKIGFKF